MYMIKNVSVNKRMSEETTCFSADLYLNGVKVLAVSNRGYGGCNDYNEHLKGALDKADAYAKSLPSIDFGGTTLPFDLDLMVDDLLNSHLLEKDAKKYLKSFCFKDGGYLYTMKVSPDCAKTAAYVASKYPNAIIMREIADVIAHLKAQQ